mmetsp:Transcript_5993/g.12006  ORF Transcript_5993/g.12006 Transcript_5993/m.12006 type:complete len:147 (-) Transcript_5993:40-480(-)
MPLKNPVTNAVFSATLWDFRVPSSRDNARPEERALVVETGFISITVDTWASLRAWWEVMVRGWGLIGTKENASMVEEVDMIVRSRMNDDVDFIEGSGGVQDKEPGESQSALLINTLCKAIDVRSASVLEPVYFSIRSLRVVDDGAC